MRTSPSIRRLRGLPQLFVLRSHRGVEGRGEVSGQRQSPHQLQHVGEILQAMGRAQA